MSFLEGARAAAVSRTPLKDEVALSLSEKNRESVPTKRNYFSSSVGLRC